MRILIVFLVPFLLSGCQVYRSNFDCTPGKGIPCRSVSEIEAMIAETTKGPDILLEQTLDSLVEVRGCCAQKRIWVAPCQDFTGEIVPAHYLNFNLGEDE